MILKHLRKYLPKYWADVIAEKHNVSPSHVRNVLVGNRENPDIAASIVELAGTHKKKIMEIQQKAEAI